MNVSISSRLDEQRTGAGAAFCALALTFASGCSGASSTDRNGFFDDGQPTTGGAPSGFEATGGALPGSSMGGSTELPPPDPTSGAGGAAGGSGPPAEEQPPPSYDPNVRFDWPETVASGDPCLPGTYVGEFTCEVTFIGLFPANITGPVSFTLEPSADGEFLEVRDGTLEGHVAEYNVTFTSPLTGQLECDGNAFSADAPSGSYSDGLFIVGQFTGALDAQLDRPTQTLSGSWTLATYPDASITCTGPWSAVRQP